MPRTRPNSRVKDLPDLALLATARLLEARRVRGAIERTFDYRATHPMPQSVPPAPEDWSLAYAALASEDQLPWHSLNEVLDAVSKFLDPVLSNATTGEWIPEVWSWQKESGAS